MAGQNGDKKHACGMRKYDELVVTEQPEKMEARWTYVPGAPHALFVVENDKLQCLDDKTDVDPRGFIV